MGSFTNNLRIKMQFSKRVREAALQMYAHVQAGRSFEIPSNNSKDDLTVRSVLCLRQMYPDVPVVYQARGIIIGRVDKTMKVGAQAWEMMDKGRYLPAPGLAQNPEAFLADQAAFVSSQGLDMDVEVAEGQRRQAARDALVMSGESGVGAERKAVTTQALVDEQERIAERAAHKAAVEANITAMMAEGKKPPVAIYAKVPETGDAEKAASAVSASAVSAP